MRAYCLIGLFGALLSQEAEAAVVWRGDFETGNRNQFYAEQMVSSDRLAVVTDPVAQGKYALKVTVKQGDDPIDASGNRNELVYKGYEAVGSEYWYRWRTMFPDSYPNANSWALFTQWHQDSDCCGSPPVSFYTVGNEIRLQVGGGNEHVVWTTPLVRGVWHEFIFHVKWAPDAKGFVELYYDGELVLPKTYGPNMQAGDLNYLKLGLYRDDSISPTGIVFHDDFIQATAKGDVFPPPAAANPPDPGTPADEDVPTPVVLSGLPSLNGDTTDDVPHDVIHARGLGCAQSPGQWTAALPLLLTGLMVLRRRSRRSL